jgi:hypothetical protein
VGRAIPFRIWRGGRTLGSTPSIHGSRTISIRTRPPVDRHGRMLLPRVRLAPAAPMGAIELAADWRRPGCRGHSNRREVGVIGALLEFFVGVYRIDWGLLGLRVVRAAGYRNDKSRRRWSPGARGFGVGRCLSTWCAEGEASLNRAGLSPGMFVSCPRPPNYSILSDLSDLSECLRMLGPRSEHVRSRCRSRLSVC